MSIPTWITDNFEPDIYARILHKGEGAASNAAWLPIYGELPQGMIDGIYTLLTREKEMRDV